MAQRAHVNHMHVDMHVLVHVLVLNLYTYFMLVASLGAWLKQWAYLWTCMSRAIVYNIQLLSILISYFGACVCIYVFQDRLDATRVVLGPAQNLGNVATGLNCLHLLPFLLYLHQNVQYLCFS